MNIDSVSIFSINLPLSSFTSYFGVNGDWQEFPFKEESLCSVPD